MFVPPSSPVAPRVCPAPRLEALCEGDARDQVHSLLAEFESLTDPRGASGVHYRLSSLLALVVCAMTPAGHDSVTAAAEWCRRAAPEELAAFGLPYHPLLGRYRVPSEKTLRGVLSRLDPAELSAAGFSYLKSLLPDEHAVPAPLLPDGGPEREQRRAHRAAAQAEPPRRRHRAITVDGKCLRGAKRPDGRQVFVLSAVRHGDGITLASREIGAKTNEIPEFQPLLDQVDDTDLAGAVIRMVNEFGDKNGCAACGASESGYNDGHWTGDHNPPNKLSPSGPWTLYPHCKTCSRKQGGIVNGILRGWYDNFPIYKTDL